MNNEQKAATYNQLMFEYTRVQNQIASIQGESINLNHKIVSIEPNGIIPVYDLTVPGYKNFATDTIFSHNTPEISAALDIYSEESTTTNEDGFILQIYSESKRIKSLIEEQEKEEIGVY